MNMDINSFMFLLGAELHFYEWNYYLIIPIIVCWEIQFVSLFFSAPVGWYGPLKWNYLRKAVMRKYLCDQ